MRLYPTEKDQYSELIQPHYTVYSVNYSFSLSIHFFAEYCRIFRLVHTAPDNKHF